LCKVVKDNNFRVGGQALGISTQFCARGARLRIAGLLFILSAILSCAGPRLAFAQEQDPCPKGILDKGNEQNPKDIVITHPCTASPYFGGAYFFGNVNIIQGGQLEFGQPAANGAHTDFWARSIIVENSGSLRAVGPSKGEPYGTSGQSLTIHLYGPDQSNGDPTSNPGMGALCKTPETADTGPCGIPMDFWANEKGNGATEVDLPGGVHDYFYRYGPLHGDEKCSNGDKWAPTPEKQDKEGVPYRCDERANGATPSSVKVGYFGYKVLGVSYGGQIELRGLVGRCHDGSTWPRERCNQTWGRLAASISPRDGPETTKKGISIDTSAGGPFISEHDQIVVTTTDYLPGHSETFTVTKVVKRGDVTTVYVDGEAQFPHNGTRYSLANRLNERLKASVDPELVKGGAETRAAVAILNRSIRIVSGGDKPGDAFPDSPAKDGTKCEVKANGMTDGQGPCYSFGGHMVIRQGFQSAVIEGVEFRQMGQGGRLAHYPVHFHMARKTPDDTLIARNSINESMTRWIVLHSTSHVSVNDNIGYKSIGHGFYLEDATETGNVFANNLGIFARAAIDNDQNPRKIAGILSDNQSPKSFRPPDLPNNGFPYRSDSEYPSVFWITNGWNSFVGNMAAGAGTCGACIGLSPPPTVRWPTFQTTKLRARGCDGAATPPCRKTRILPERRR
jgi:cell migration-inducing and hyaluronan-binding protein